MELRKGWKGLIACKAARMQQNSHHSHQLAGDVEDVHWAPRRRCCLPRAREKCECKSVINGQEIGNRDGESHTFSEFRLVPFSPTTGSQLRASGHTVRVPVVLRA